MLNPAGALAFAQAGNKSEDKLTKAELIDLLRKVRAERDEALAAVEVLKSAMESAEAEDASDNEDLDVEAEAVDSDEDFEADAAEVG